MSTIELDKDGLVKRWGEMAQPNPEYRPTLASGRFEEMLIFNEGSIVPVPTRLVKRRKWKRGL